MLAFILQKLNRSSSRYLLVAIIATFIDWVVYALALEFLNLHYLLANTLSFIVGVCINYALCNLLVFKDRAWEHKPWVERALFLGTALLGLFINSLALGSSIWFLKLNFCSQILQYLCAFFMQITPLLGSLFNPEILAKIFATGIAFFWNYWSKKHFVYKKSFHKHRNYL